MGVALHHIVQIADPLTVVLLQPQGGIDVPGGGGGIQHRPGGAVQVVPGQLLPGVDLGEQLLALLAGTGQQDTAVVSAHVLCVLLDGAVVPVGGVLRVLVDGIAQGGQQHIAVVGEEHIVAAGDEAQVRAARAEGLAHGGVAGAHGHVDLAHVVALFQQLCLQQLLQRLRGLGDEVGVRIGRKCDFQRVHLLYIGVGRSLRRLPGAAAGQESGAQRQAQQKCGNLLFHGNPSSLIFCAKQNGHAPHQHIPVQTFTQMLMPPLPPGKPGAVGPYWDPLSLEHRLPRNLVLVIYVSVAPGSSPFRRIP